jgi:hypothetical protein
MPRRSILASTYHAARLAFAGPSARPVTISSFLPPHPLSYQSRPESAWPAPRQTADGRSVKTRPLCRYALWHNVPEVFHGYYSTNFRVYRLAAPV